MRWIVAGSRSVTDRDVVFNAIDTFCLDLTQIVSGGARGVDSLAEEYADFYEIEKRIYKADWDRLGKKAGYLRNVEMAKNADGLLAIWDGRSKGTKHMIDIALNHNLKVHIVDASRSCR